MASKKERAEYNEHRDRTSRELGLTKHHYNALRRVANGLSEAGTNSANGRDRSGKEYTEKHYNKDCANAFHKAEALRKKVGGKHAVHFYHQQDPRGVSLYAGKERMSHNDYNSKGRPIY